MNGSNYPGILIVLSTTPAPPWQGGVKNDVSLFAKEKWEDSVPLLAKEKWEDSVPLFAKEKWKDSVPLLAEEKWKDSVPFLFKEGLGVVAFDDTPYACRRVVLNPY